MKFSAQIFSLFSALFDFILLDELSVRLSSHSVEGGDGDSVSLVEVWSSGEWRGVCDEGGWGHEEAETVCKQLGYHGNTVTTGRVYI